MADRYFDRNGVTAGFGTLTGNWDTTTASWSTSAAGTGNVVVNGIVKTRGGTTQKGQVRYGGNVVFNAGSSLYIGAAA